MKNKIHNHIKRSMLFLLLALVLFTTNVTSASASGWINEESDEYKALYGDNAVIGDEEPFENSITSLSPTSIKSNILEEILAGAVAVVAHAIDSLLHMAPVDLSVDGIVYGRMSPSSEVYWIDGSDMNPNSEMRIDLVHFGLEPNNPWGIFAASLYYIIRKICFVAVPIVILLMLFNQLWKNSQKGREQLKEVIQRALVFFLLCYTLPYIVEAFIYLRDVAMMLTGDGLNTVLQKLMPNGLAFDTFGIFDMAKALFSVSFSLVDALLMLASCLAGVFYLFDYIKIAILVSVLFGFAPMFVFIYLWNPRILDGWSKVIFPSLLTPFIDMLLLKLPVVISLVYTSVFGSSIPDFIHGDFTKDRTADVILCIILLVCIWNARMIRDRVLKLLGLEGMPKAQSLGMAFLMLARLAGQAAGHGGHGGNGAVGTAGTAVDAANKADQFREMDAMMNRADEDIDKLVQPSSTETLGTTYAEYNNETDKFLADMNKQEEAIKELEESASTGMNSETLGDVERNSIDTPVEPIQNSEMMEPDERMETGVPETVGAEDVVQKFADDKAPVPQDIDIPEESIPQMDVVPHGNDNILQFAEQQTQVKLPMMTPMSETEKIFRDGMSIRDQKRYDNLRQLDALENRFENNNKIMESAGYSRGSYESTYKAEQSRNASLHHHSERLQQQIESMGQQGADTSAFKADLERVNVAKQQSDARLEQLKKASMADRENQFYQRHIDYRKEVEARYATNSGLGGMNTRTYENAATFMHQKQIEQIKKQHQDFRNFDSAQYDGILTPQEREMHYRERAKRIYAEKAAKVVGVAAAVPAAAVGMFALGYGGTGASVIGAYATGRVASNLASKGMLGTVDAVNEISDGIHEDRKKWELERQEAQQREQRQRHQQRDAREEVINGSNAYEKRMKESTERDAFEEVRNHADNY